MEFFQRRNDAFDCALMASQENNYLPYDGMDLYADPSHQKNLKGAFSWKTPILLSEAPSPESKLIKKDLTKALSPDAKFILNAIRNEEEVLTPATENITLRSIRKFLEKHHWNTRRVQRAFKEMQMFTNEL